MTAVATVSSTGFLANFAKSLQFHPFDVFGQLRFFDVVTSTDDSVFVVNGNGLFSNGVHEREPTNKSDVSS